MIHILVISHEICKLNMAVVEISPPLFFYIQYKVIGVFTMKTIIKKDGKITVTITYQNEPSTKAISLYAQKLKHTLDIKVPAR